MSFLRKVKCMKAGKAFELLIKRILLHIGFSEVASDGLYIFDGPPGQMIQGLAEAHNADVLLEPPVQTPFLKSYLFAVASTAALIARDCSLIKFSQYLHPLIYRSTSWGLKFFGVLIIMLPPPF